MFCVRNIKLSTFSACILFFQRAYLARLNLVQTYLFPNLRTLEKSSVINLVLCVRSFITLGLQLQLYSQSEVSLI